MRHPAVGFSPVPQTKWYNASMDERMYGEDVDTLELEKYGLSDLDGKNILALDDADLDRLLAALGDDDMSLNLPMQCTADKVQELLSYSECRRCGRCCRPNPLNPESPGVEIFEEELQSIADSIGEPYESLKKKTGPGKATPYAYQVVKLGFTRWLPLPCPAYSSRENGCRAYSVRPVVCKTYPVIFTGDDSYTSIRVTCDYGRDIVKAACKRIHRDNPSFEIML